MIHSFEFYLEVDDCAINQLLTTYGLSGNSMSNVKSVVKSINQKIIHLFDGIKFTTLREKHKRSYYLSLKVDLVKLLTRNNIEEKDYQLIHERIQDMINHSFGMHVSFESHVLTRIDYKHDVYLNNEAESELLFHLIEKQTNKYRQKTKIRWMKDENGIPYRFTSSQYHKNASSELFVYNKELERKAKNEPISNYQNMVRVELRLRNGHLNSKKRQDEILFGKKLSNYFSDALRREYFQSHVVPIMHSGDYCKINLVRQKLKLSNFSKVKKERLEDFMISISRGSLDTPKNHLSPATYRNYLKELSSLGINPILIPKNRKDFPSFFKNPFSF
ncbi:MULTISPECIES: phage/plasmid replication protein [Allobacillus]|uniref:Replication-associated protein G2P N-terminal domain-containing protein n=1 Tax=Allobacillus salarius TaxID=1955272 RepID=A0A556PDL4_9BACI|nr:phage/plasmid replication protein [Allobacillus salarius]TSJ62491.1 hypothetical protein FPQ13_09865 [Allobacillus salarius]